MILTTCLCDIVIDIVRINSIFVTPGNWRVEIINRFKTLFSCYIWYIRRCGKLLWGIPNSLQASGSFSSLSRFYLWCVNNLVTWVQIRWTRDFVNNFILSWRWKVTALRIFSNFHLWLAPQLLTHFASTKSFQFPFIYYIS